MLLFLLVSRCRRESEKWKKRNETTTMLINIIATLAKTKNLTACLPTPATSFMTWTNQASNPPSPLLKNAHSRPQPTPQSCLTIDDALQSTPAEALISPHPSPPGTRQSNDATSYAGRVSRASWPASARSVRA